MIAPKEDIHLKLGKINSLVANIALFILLCLIFIYHDWKRLKRDYNVIAPSYALIINDH